MSIAIWVIAVCQTVVAVGWIFQLAHIKADMKRVQSLFEFDKERQEWERANQARLAKWYKESDE